MHSQLRHVYNVQRNGHKGRCLPVNYIRSQITQITCRTESKMFTLFTFSFCIYLHLSQFSLISKDIKYYSWPTTQLSVIGELTVWNSPTKQLFLIYRFANWRISWGSSPIGEVRQEFRQLAKLPLAKTGIGDKILPPFFQVRVHGCSFFYGLLKARKYSETHLSMSPHYSIKPV